MFDFSTCNFKEFSVLIFCLNFCLPCCLSFPGKKQNWEWRYLLHNWNKLIFSSWVKPNKLCFSLFKIFPHAMLDQFWFSLIYLEKEFYSKNILSIKSKLTISLSLFYLEKTFLNQIFILNGRINDLNTYCSRVIGLILLSGLPTLVLFNAEM